MKIRKVLFLFSILIFWACNSKENDTEELASTVAKEVKPTIAEFILVDSIMVDVIGNLDVYDYNPKTGLFLAGDINSSGILILGAAQNFNTLGHLLINQQGKIVHQFKRFDRGPEGFGGSASDHFFLGDSSIAVLSRVGLFQYDLEGSFQKKYQNINTQDVIGYSTFKISAADGKGNIALGLAKGMEEATRVWDSIFQIVKPLRFYDLEVFETGYEGVEVGEKATFGYPNHLVYEPQSPIGASQYPPMVEYNDETSEVYALYRRVPTLEIYDINSAEAKTNWQLQPEYFGEYVEPGYTSGAIKGYESLAWSNRGGMFANSFYHQLTQLGDYTLLRYNSPIPNDVVQSLLVKSYRKDERWPSIRKEHYRFYYQLFKDGQKVIPDFQIPQLEPQPGQKEFMFNRETRGKIVGGDGLDRIYVLIPNDGEHERDYELIRVYKLELK